MIRHVQKLLLLVGLSFPVLFTLELVVWQWDIDAVIYQLVWNTVDE